MGRAKKTKKFATMKRMISASDPRLKDNERDKPKKGKKEVGTHQPLFDDWLELNLMNTFYTQLSVNFYVDLRFLNLAILW